MSGSTATTPMILDTGLGGGSASQLGALTQEFGRLYELPPTKSMKVMTKNLVLKIDRLEKRLLKYANIIAASDEEGWLFNPLNGEHYTVNTEEAKKHLQFRLVGVDTIRKTNLERLNRAVSLSAIAIIGADVNEDLDDAKTKLNNSLTTLKQELDDYREKALASSLIPQDEQDAERIRHVAYWESLTTYNERMFEQHLLKLKGGAMKPPSKPAKTKDDTHVRLNSKKRKDPPAASNKNKQSGNKKAKTKRQGNKKGKGQQKDKRNRRKQPVTSSKKQGKQPVGKSKNKSGPSAGSGKKQGGKSSRK